MDAEEVQNISALVEQSSKMDESFGQFFDGAARDSTTIFSHTSMRPTHAASGVNCNCTFSRMNFNDGCCSTVRTWRPGRKVTSCERENHVLSNIALFFGIVTASTHTKSGRQGGLPKPLSALRMMTTDDEGRSFFGPNGVLTKSFASMRAAGMELHALIGRQASAKSWLLALLADRGGAAAPIAIAGAVRAGADLERHRRG